MNRVLPILTITILLTTCSPIKVPVAREVKQTFSICYTPSNIHAEQHIRLDGYYFYFDGVYVVNSYMFYNDGTVVGNVHGDYLINSNEIYEYPTTWGTYFIKNDTIITQIILHNFQSSDILQGKFVILNDTCLLRISNQALIESSASDDQRTYEFKDIGVKPDSFCWLKKEKWFWCNKEEWKTYMKEVKSLNR